VKTTLTTFLSFTLLGVCASAVLGQQTYPASFAAPPVPVNRFVSTDTTNVSAFGAEAQRAISSEINRGTANTANHGGGGCGSGCCNSGCNSGCCSCACNDCNHCCVSKCCYGCCLHRTGAFAEWLYLSPRNIDLAYAVPQDGLQPGIPGVVPQGNVAVLDLDYDSGVRIGFSLCLDCNSSVRVTYSWFDTDTTDAIAENAPRVIRPLVAHPNTANSGFTSQQAAGVYDIEYELFDVDYRAVLWSCKGAHVDYVVGARYAHLESAFAAVYPFATPDGTEVIATDINFDGGGIRIGLEGERRLFRRSGLSVYSKGHINALAGQFSSNYIQVDQFNGLEVLVGWQDDRVITISELEAGVAWQNCRGNLRVAAGYYFAIWDNVVTTPEWIDAVQNVNFVDVSQDDDDTIAFDGLVVRGEYLF
jgi:hypothetical protein